MSCTERRRPVKFKFSLEKLKSVSWRVFIISLLNTNIKMWSYFNLTMTVCSILFEVIYRKPCLIHIKSVRKVMSTTFGEIFFGIWILKSVFQLPHHFPRNLHVAPPLPKAVSLPCAPLSFYCPPSPECDNYCTVPNWIIITSDDVCCNIRKFIEWFSLEYRKTKTKVITLANHKEHRQYSEPIKTRSNSSQERQHPVPAVIKMKSAKSSKIHDQLELERLR